MPWYNPISITVVLIVWGNCCKTPSEKLQKVQNSAARILTSSFYDADAGYLLQRLGWKDLIAQRQIQVALMVFKALIMIWLLTTSPLCLLSAVRHAMS